MSEVRSSLQAEYATKFRELQAQTRVDTYPKLRALYLNGTIEAEEFEERLDALLRVDPKALDRPSPAPGRRGSPSALEVLAANPLSPRQKAAAIRAFQRQAVRRKYGGVA